MHACVSEPCLPVRTWDSPLQLLPLLALPCSPDRGKRVGGRVLVFPSRPVCLRAGKRSRAASQGIARIKNTTPRVGKRSAGAREVPRRSPRKRTPHSLTDLRHGGRRQRPRRCAGNEGYTQTPHVVPTPQAA